MSTEQVRTITGSDLARIAEASDAMGDGDVIAYFADANMWVIRAYDLIRYVLRNDERLFRLAHPDTVSSHALAEMRGGKRTHRLLRGPDHERIHRWYMKWFLPAEVERYLREHIRPLVTRLIDRFASRGRAELWSEYCQPMGPRVIAAVLGLPVSPDDEGFFQQSQAYNDAVLRWNSAPDDQEVVRAAIEASRRMNEMLLPTVRARRDDLRSDLISRMWKEGPTVVPDWAEDDVLVATREMLLGASGTTRDALANALHILLTEERLRQRVLAGPANLGSFVEESLRLHDSRTIAGLPRVAMQDVEIAGHLIRRGQIVALLSDHGGRDADHYQSSPAIDLGRTSPKDHFAFGAGPRACIGANLGRAQIRAGLEGLFRRLPTVMLDRTKEPPARAGLGIGHGKSSYAPLHVTF